MKVPNKIIKDWKLLADHGDYVAIAEKAGVNYRTVSKAFKTKECDILLFNAIQAFYAERKKMLNPTTDDNN